MKKIKLNLSDLRIESFETFSNKKTTGTVKGNGETIVYTCNGQICSYYECPTNDHNENTCDIDCNVKDTKILHICSPMP